MHLRIDLQHSFVPSAHKVVDIPQLLHHQRKALAQHLAIARLPLCSGAGRSLQQRGRIQRRRPKLKRRRRQPRLYKDGRVGLHTFVSWDIHTCMSWALGRGQRSGGWGAVEGDGALHWSEMAIAVAAVATYIVAAATAVPVAAATATATATADATADTTTAAAAIAAADTAAAAVGDNIAIAIATAAAAAAAVAAAAKGHCVAFATAIAIATAAAATATTAATASATMLHRGVRHKPDGSFHQAPLHQRGQMLRHFARKVAEGLQ